MKVRKARRPQKLALSAELRRNRFAQEYIKDLNGTQAAIRSGYSSKGADVTACRLLADARVKVQVDAMLAKIAAANTVTVERTLKEIARIAYGDHRKLYDQEGRLRPLHELDDDSAALIAGLESEEMYGPVGEEGEGRTIIGLTRKVKTWSKNRALDQCMAYLGMHKSLPAGEGGGLQLSINLSGGKKIR